MRYDCRDFIIFEDEDIFLINKPYGMSTLDDRDHTKTTVLSMVKAYHPDAQLCHRLDKETSGILAVAKNAAAYRHMALQFEHRQVVKIYHAVVQGNKKLDHEMVELPIFIPKEGPVSIDFQNGKESATILNTLEIFGPYSLVACFPITGRMHQIRIHLASLKMPIVADKLYGGSDIYLSQLKRGIFKLKKWTEEQPLMQRVALHARELTFTKPNGEKVTFYAEYPKDFRALLTQLRKVL